MGMKQEESVYRSNLDIGSIRQVLRGALGNKVEISPLQFDALDDPPDFAILAAKNATFGANSALQIYINDEGDHRKIGLIALGSGGFSRVYGAAQGALANDSVKLAGGRKMATQVVEALRRQDSSLQQIG